MVFASHLDFVRPGASEILKWWYDHVLYEGYIGVTFFFILSGFILVYTYQEKFSRREIRYYDFIVARIARIYPMHVVTLLAAIPIVVAEASSTYPQFFTRLIANVTLTQSFVPSESFYFSFNGVSWSISDEMFFYILFPLILPWRKPGPYVYSAYGIAAGIVLLIMLLSPGWDQHYHFYINPLFRLIDFTSGIALYGLYERLSNNRISATYFGLMELGSVGLFLLFFIFHNSVPEVFRYSCYYWLPIGFVLLAFSFQGGFLSRILSSPTLVLAGEISYGFYLLHVLVIRYFFVINEKFHLLNNVGLMIMVVFSITLGLSYISRTILEIPAAGYIKRKFGHRTTIAGSAK
jgi:peptidoglycan/LPS O-acetylase OafA/YrhL